ncbi:MAG: transglutaminase domain-containing protein, partial [Gammaproteobacteria bacterium]|nr:transglutaminase domain-containing protein [Gammaproteobacteria bacterium]
LRWLPLLLAPFTVAQAWRVEGAIDLKALWSNRQRHEPRPARPYPADFRWLYLPICLVAASAANQRGPLFFAALVLLGAWALFACRDRSRPLALWAVLVATATGLGYAGQAGLHRLQGLLFEAAFSAADGGGDATDPYRSRTALGRIGELKRSDAIVLRVRPASGEPPPERLHRATYDRFAGTTWFTRDAPLAPVEGTGESGRWVLAPGVTPERRVTIAANFAGDRAVLPVPPGAVRLDGLAVPRLERNRFGVLQVARPERVPVRYEVASLAGFDPPSASPTPADLAVPERLRPLLARHSDALGLAGLPPAEAVRRLASWFEESFGYALYQREAPLDGHALESFLERSRAGHCEYFATATVLLLRAAGIPARYVTGYAVVEWSELEQAYVVRRRHAHAWGRAYVDGAWRPVDTTPSTWIDEERAEASKLQPLLDGWAWLTHRYRLWRQRDGDAGLPRTWWPLPAGLLLLAAWWLRRRLRAARTDGETGRDRRTATRRADSPYDRLEHHLATRGHGRGAHELPTRWAARIAPALSSPALAPDLEAIVRLHYAYRFDPAADTAVLHAELERRVAAWLAAHDRAGGS